MDDSWALPFYEEIQNLLFSPNSDLELIKEKIEEIKGSLSPNAIDRQLILAFSLNYNKIPILTPLLSKTTMNANDFVHFDQILLFHLLQVNISFPISVMIPKRGRKLKIEKFLYEELLKQNKFDELQRKCDQYHMKIKIREKTKIEEIIENDDIESFKLLSNTNDFDFNQKIKKINILYHYTRIPIILYCIEKNAYKCFKFALINGADPTQKSEKLVSRWRKEFKRIWDAYGFAGAKGNIQIIRMLKERGLNPNSCLMEGCSQFHQNMILEWIKDEESQLLDTGIKTTIHYENYQAFSLFVQRKNDLNILVSQKNFSQITLLQYALLKKANEIGELLISKGAYINAIYIIYPNIIILFLIKII